MLGFLSRKRRSGARQDTSEVNIAPGEALPIAELTNAVESHGLLRFAKQHGDRGHGR